MVCMCHSSRRGTGHYCSLVDTENKASMPLEMWEIDQYNRIARFVPEIAYNSPHVTRDLISSSLHHSSCMEEKRVIEAILSR